MVLGSPYINPTADERRWASTWEIDRYLCTREGISAKEGPGSQRLRLQIIVKPKAFRHKGSWRLPSD